MGYDGIINTNGIATWQLAFLVWFYNNYLLSFLDLFPLMLHNYIVSISRLQNLKLLTIIHYEGHFNKPHACRITPLHLFIKERFVRTLKIISNIFLKINEVR